jgi:nucleoside-diphosphate-sugar epimerase
VRVLVLGGTGSIGEPVVRALVRARHQVWALARSGVAADGLASLGAEPVAGDLRAPAGWLHALPAVEAVIHAAGTFTDDEAEIDRRLLGSLLPHLSARSRPVRFIYTGGCWLYGISEHCALNEEAPFDPLEPYAWMIANLRLVLGAPGLEAMVIHPAMVYEASGGVFARFLADARQRHAVRLVGAAQVSWPLVHRDDLADLYRRVLEAGAPGESYLGAAIEGLSVGRIAQAFARRFATPSLEPEVISADEIAAELGSWARGYARSQRLSGAKARRYLGWAPMHLDPESEIAAIS